MSKKSDEEAATDAFKIFAESFGEVDEITRVVLEILLEEIMGVSSGENN